MASASPSPSAAQTQTVSHNCDLDQIAKIVDFLKTKTADREAPPIIGIICGSGLSTITDTLSDPFVVPYSEIPDFPTAHVKGHGNSLVFGHFEGHSVVCMKGRFHYYSGYSMQQVVLGVRVMAGLGVRKMIVTNAAGSLNPEYNVGDVVVISDHINLPGICGLTPLVGQNDDRLGPRFPPMSDVYDKNLQSAVVAAAKQLKYDQWIRTGGIYAAVIGPSYETPAEARFLRQIGGDCVGMSTIPEVLAARHAGMKVLCLSLISNKVVLNQDQTPASHQEVLEAVQLRVSQLPALVRSVVVSMGRALGQTNSAIQSNDGANKSQ